MKARDDLTLEHVKERYSYNSETGEIFSKINKRVVGCETGGGYLCLNINQKMYKAHRIAWLLHYENWPENEIDHIDGNPSNNIISNLRSAQHFENCKNRKLNKNNKSGHKGVSWSKKRQKWRVDICIDKKWKIIGFFENIEDAVISREKEESKFYGEYKRKLG